MTLTYYRLLLLTGNVFSIGVASTDLYNIAFDKQTEQGPKDYCWSGGCYPSSLAVDGITNGYMLSGQCSHTTRLIDFPAMSWWKVYFRGDYYLSSIRIFRRIDWNMACCRDRFRNITIEGIFDKNNNSKRIYADDMTDTIYNRVINITIPKELRNSKFSAIKISVPNFSLTLCEVQVFQAVSCGPVSKSLPVSNGVWKHTDTECSHYMCEYVLACNTGYTTPNTSYITTVCDKSGNWTQPTEQCQAVSCGSVTKSLPVSNGVWKHTDNGCSHYLCEYVLACNTGYTTSSTSYITTVCDESGHWTQRTELCQASTRSMDSKGLSAVEGGLIGAGMVLLIQLIAIIAYKILRRLRNPSKDTHTYEANSFDRNDAQPYCSIVNTTHSDNTELQLCSTTVEQNNPGMYANTNMSFDKDIKSKTMQ